MKLTDLEIENILINLELSIKESCVWAYYNDEKTTLDISYDFESDEYSEGLWLFGDEEKLTVTQQNRVVEKMECFYNEELINNRNDMFLQKEQLDIYLDNLFVIR